MHAELARDLIPTLTRGQWRYAITDRRWHLRHAGLTRTRPTGMGVAAGRTRDLVELQIPTALLDELTQDATAFGEWTPVIGDLARQHAAEHEGFAADADRRHPGAALRRHLQIRDRACIGPGCRAPARHTDQDHTLEHARGVPTLDWNLGGGCRHDHRLKGEGGWSLTQPEPGHFLVRDVVDHITGHLDGDLSASRLPPRGRCRGQRATPHPAVPRARRPDAGRVRTPRPHRGGRAAADLHLAVDAEGGRSLRVRFRRDAAPGVRRPLRDVPRALSLGSRRATRWMTASGWTSTDRKATMSR